MKLSVCVPVYNVEKYIERCARSLFEQTIADDIEFVFVDDGSSDNSVDVLNQILQDYPSRRSQTRIIRHSQNKGVAAARNTFLDVASGEYIGFVDPDDYVLPKMFEKLLGTAADEGADFVFEGMSLMYRHRTVEMLQAERFSTAAEVLTKIFRGLIHGGMPTKLVRKSFMERHGVRFNESLSCYEDVCFVAHVLSHDPVVGFCHAADYCYVQRRSSLVHDKAINRLRGARAMYDDFSELEGTWGKDVQAAFRCFWSRLCMELMFDTGKGLPYVLNVMGGGSSIDFRGLDCGRVRKVLLWLCLHHANTLVWAMKRLFVAVSSVWKYK